MDNLFSNSGLWIETEMIGRKTVVLHCPSRLYAGHSFLERSVRQQLMIFS